jgi:cell division protease FtsH
MAERVIDEHREGLVELAELLLDREVVFTEDVERIFGKRGSKKEVAPSEVAEASETSDGEASAEEVAEA